MKISQKTFFENFINLLTINSSIKWITKKVKSNFFQLRDKNRCQSNEVYQGDCICQDDCISELHDEVSMVIQNIIQIQPIILTLNVPIPEKVKKLS